MKHKLGKMIRRLNKQQSQYCTEVPDYDAAPSHEKEYRYPAIVILGSPSLDNVPPGGKRKWSIITNL